MAAWVWWVMKGTVSKLLLSPSLAASILLCSWLLCYCAAVCMCYIFQFQNSVWAGSGNVHSIALRTFETQMSSYASDASTVPSIFYRSPYLPILPYTFHRHPTCIFLFRCIWLADGFLKPPYLDRLKRNSCHNCLEWQLWQLIPLTICPNEIPQIS